MDPKGVIFLLSNAVQLYIWVHIFDDAPDSAGVFPTEAGQTVDGSDDMVMADLCCGKSSLIFFSCRLLLSTFTHTHLANYFRLS